MHVNELDAALGRELADKARSQLIMPQERSGYRVHNPHSGNMGPLFDTEAEAHADLQRYPGASNLRVIPHTERTPGRSAILNNTDLHVGGEGMKKYYDEIVPSRMMALAKMHDPEAKFDTSAFRGAERPFPSLTITPRMRESIKKNGFSQFKRGGAVEKDGVVERALALVRKARR